MHITTKAFSSTKRHGPKSRSSPEFGIHATLSIDKIPKNNRPNGWEGSLPNFNGKERIVISQLILYNYLSPNMITNKDKELHR